MNVTFIFQNIINGVTIGSIYALMALGYTLVYSASRLVNFAQGEGYMLGAFATLFALGAVPEQSPSFVRAIAAGVAAMVAAVLLGWATERFVFRPLRNAPPFIPVMASLGLAIAIENTVLNLFGAGFNNVPALWPLTGIQMADVRMSYVQLVMLTVAVLLMVLLDRFLRGTLPGKALRAVAQDPTAARLMGISTEAAVALVFVVAAGLSGVSGYFVALYYGSVNFYMGFQAGINGFAAAIFGGFGNVKGAIVGGILLGIFEAFGSSLVPAEWKGVIAYVLLLLVILIRPQGIFGEALPERL